MNDFYVYEHWRPDKGVCFYVGKGRKRRAWSMARKNAHHRAIVSKLTSLGLAVDVRIVIGQLSEETAFCVEQERIALYDFSQLANQTKGGPGNAGWSPSSETRANMSKSFKGRKLSPEHKAKISAFFRGRPLSPEHVEKLRMANKGKPPSANTIAAAVAKLQGKKRSPESVAKMVATKTGVPLSPEWRAAISKGQRGKVLSLEHRAKLREAWKTRPPISDETKKKLSASARLDWARRKGAA